MKKLMNLFILTGMFLESYFTKRKNTIWEFVDDIDENYGKFKNVATKKVSILSKDGFLFLTERFYKFEPKNLLTGFGYLGTPQIHKQTWKAVSYP